MLSSQPPKLIKQTPQALTKAEEEVRALYQLVNEQSAEIKELKEALKQQIGMATALISYLYNSEKMKEKSLKNPLLKTLQGHTSPVYRLQLLSSGELVS